MLSALARFVEDIRFDFCTKEDEEQIDEEAQVVVGTPVSVCGLLVRGLLSKNGVNAKLRR